MNTYTKYEVKIEGEFCYRSEELEGEFATEKYSDSLILDGGQLIELIAKNLQQHNISEFNMTGNEIAISKFDPFSGETSDCKIIYTPTGTIFVN